VLHKKRYCTIVALIRKMGGLHLSVFPNFNGMASDGLSSEARLRSGSLRKIPMIPLDISIKGGARGGP
jgi:hypothetical protein